MLTRDSAVGSDQVETAPAAAGPSTSAAADPQAAREAAYQRSLAAPVPEGEVGPTELRPMSLPMLLHVRGQVHTRCDVEGWFSSNPSKPNERLTPKTANLYDLNVLFILPQTGDRKCSYVSFVAEGPRRPRWFASHWWGEVSPCACRDKRRAQMGHSGRVGGRRIASLSLSRVRLSLRLLAAQRAACCVRLLLIARVLHMPPPRARACALAATARARLYRVHRAAREGPLRHVQEGV